MSKPLMAVIAALMIVIASGGWQLNSLNKRLKVANTTIGQHEATIAQHETTIGEINATNEKLIANAEATDKIIADSIKLKNAIQSKNNKLNKRLRDLQNENDEIKAYLNQPLPVDVVGLFAAAPQDNHSDGNGNSQTAPSPSSASASPVLNERLIEHSLALESALDQCNQQIESIALWAMTVE